MMKDFLAEMKGALPMLALCCSGTLILASAGALAVAGGNTYLGITLASMGLMWGVWSLIASASAEALLLMLRKPVSHRRIARIVAPFSAIAALLPLLSAKAQPVALAIESQRQMADSSVNLTLCLLAAALLGAFAYLGRTLILAKTEE